MTVLRKLAMLAAAAAAPLLTTAVWAEPASAHGATTNPVSRVAACGQGGQLARSTACQAAVAANGGQSFADWSNLRVADVAGRDRAVIPDGKLCSGGLDKYRGLDLPRTDWPSTKLTAGAGYTFRYGETIPHEGTFRVYVTKDGYDPTQPLRWSELESKPFLTATDPPLRNDAYVFAGKLPSGKTGRHLIYTIWQNSSTPDTYYSCSDVVFASRTAASAAAAPTADPTPTPTRQGVAQLGKASPASAAPVAAEPVAATSESGHTALPLTVAAVAALATIGVTVAAFLRRRRA